MKKKKKKSVKKAKKLDVKRYTVTGYDTFSNEPYPIGKYSSLEEAINIAKDKGGVMNKTYVHNEYGVEIRDFGTY